MIIKFITAIIFFSFTNIYGSFFSNSVFVFFPKTSDNSIDWHDTIIHDSIFRTIDGISAFNNIYIEDFFNPTNLTNTYTYNELSNNNEIEKLSFVKKNKIDYYITWTYDVNNKQIIIFSLYDDNGNTINSVSIQLDNDVDLWPIQDAVISLVKPIKELNTNEVAELKSKYTFKKYYASVYFAKGYANYIHVYDSLINFYKKFDSRTFKYENKLSMSSGIDAFKKSLEIEESGQAHVLLSNLFYVGNFLLGTFPPKQYMLEHCSKGLDLNKNINCIKSISEVRIIPSGTYADHYAVNPAFVSSFKTFMDELMSDERSRRSVEEDLEGLIEGHLYFTHEDMQNAIAKILKKQYFVSSGSYRKSFLLGKLKYLLKEYESSVLYFNKALNSDDRLTKVEASMYLIKLCNKNYTCENPDLLVANVLERFKENPEKEEKGRLYEILGDFVVNRNLPNGLEYFSKAERIKDTSGSGFAVNSNRQRSSIKYKYAKVLYDNKMYHESYVKALESYNLLIEYQLNSSDFTGDEQLLKNKQDVLNLLLDSGYESNIDGTELYETLMLNKNDSLVSNEQIFNLTKQNSSVDNLLKEIRSEREKILLSSDLDIIKKIRESIKEKENQLYRLNKISEFSTGFKNFKQNLPEMLPKNTTIIDFYLTKNNYFAFLVDGHTFKIIKIGSKQDIETKINNGTINYDDIWKNINVSTSDIVIVPTGELYNLSFETLKQNNTFLIEKYNIHYVNSIALLSSEIKNVKNDPSVTLFANPDFDSIESGMSSEFRGLEGTQFSSLPGTALEVAKITDILKKSNNNSYKVFDGQNANENNFMNANFNGVLHLATHAFFNSTRNGFENSGILLSGANLSIENQKSYGIITSKKILTKDFSKVDLVVLSACDTGKGTLSSTKGIESLGTAFSLAGAKRTVISLQKVSDLETSLLMKEFYKNLYIEQLNVYDAFRNAKLLLLKKGYSPKSWGSFIIFG